MKRYKALIFTNVLILVCFSKLLYSQNFTIVDSIYQKVLYHDIDVFDCNDKLISIEELNKKIFRNDTILICFQADNEKFINTNYISGDIGIVQLAKNVDSVYLDSFNGYFSFFHRVLDEDTGIFKYCEELFRIKKKDLLKSSLFKQSLDTFLFCDGNLKWKIKSIQYFGHSIQLDSCHYDYNLKFYSDGTFKQFYSNGFSICKLEVDTSLMRTNKYFGTSVDHLITVTDGIWHVLKNKLYLYQPGKRVFEVNYSVNNSNLKLEFNDSNYTVLEKF